MAKGTHDYVEDGRNESVLVYVNGALVPRAEAMISVFDSGFLLGDGVWEGLRLHNGRFSFLDRHLDRLEQGARAIALDIGMSRAELTDALHRTVAANDMNDGVHVRLMVTRGLKRSPSQDPRLNVGGSTIVIIAEHKVSAEQAGGLAVATTHIRRGRPDVQDPGLNSHSKLNCVLAMVDAIEMGADEALMLDPHGFVSTCNATNFFIVRHGEVWTSTGRYCLKGITRGVVLEACAEAGIPASEKDFSLAEVYGADEAFVTGTFGGLTPVSSVDGRRIGSAWPGPVTSHLLGLYREKVRADAG